MANGSVVYDPNQGAPAPDAPVTDYNDPRYYQNDGTKLDAPPMPANQGAVSISPGSAPIIDDSNPGWNPQFLDPSQHQLDPRYLEQMRGIAFDDPGQSPWLRYQMQQDQIRQQSDIQGLQNQGASSLATQQGQMAMRGGLTSGATERLGQQNLVGMLQGRGDLSRSAAAREAAYRQQAEQRQRDVLMALPQAEQGYAGYHADLDKYAIDQRNTADAASQQAQAIRDNAPDDKPWWQF